MANVSQIVLVGLAVFGYFYTVVPVYQNQKLNEENARLSIENDSISARIGELQAASVELELKNTESTTRLAEVAVALSTMARKVVLMNIRRQLEEMTPTREAKFFSGIGQPKSQSIYDSLENGSLINSGKLIDSVFRNPADALLDSLARIQPKEIVVQDVQPEEILKILAEVKTKLSEKRKRSQLDGPKISKARALSDQYFERHKAAGSETRFQPSGGGESDPLVAMGNGLNRMQAIFEGVALRGDFVNSLQEISTSMQDVDAIIRIVFEELGA